MIRFGLRLIQRALQVGLFLLLLALSINNSQSVSLHLLWGHVWTAPLILMVLVVFAAGVLLGGLAAWPMRRRLSRGRRKFVGRRTAQTPPLSMTQEPPHAD